MREAAEQLRQSVDEAKEQHLILRSEVSALEDQRTVLLQEVAQLRATAQILPLPLAPHVVSPSFVSSRRAGVRARGECESGSDDESVQARNKEVDEEESVPVGEPFRKGRSRPASMIGPGSRQGMTSTTSGGGGSVAGTTRSGRPTTRRLGKNVVYSRSQSQGASKHQSREVYALSRVPQLEADIKICKDGLLSETLLSSKTVLTEEQFEKVQKTKKSEDEEEEDEEKDEVVWSLSCSFNVRMVPPPSKN